MVRLMMSVLSISMLFRFYQMTLVVMVWLLVDDDVMVVILFARVGRLSHFMVIGVLR